MKIFVTGSGGFIGSNLIEDLLKKGHKVTAICAIQFFNNGWLKNINDKKLKIVLGDIRDEHFMFESCKNIDVIINLAALISIPYSYKAINFYIETNIMGTSNLCKSAIKNKVKKLIHISSSEVYGSAVL